MFGVYVHWPFCAALCPYCDFVKALARDVDEAAWVDAMVAEIRFQAGFGGGPAETLYFGGGTPSLMSAGAVGRIVEAVDAAWGLAPGAEVTLEANPTSVEAGRFAGYRAAGVNRVSLGVQALDDAALRRLGRRHDAAEARAALAVARGAFDRVSFDLIYARPGQDVPAWEAELGEALALGPDHLSLYQLTIEAGTPFGALRAQGGLGDLPDDELAADLWDATQAVCGAAGLPGYEVSSHARPGAEGRHNLIYWRGGLWAGIGPGAHGRVARDGVVATAGLSDVAAWRAAAGTPEAAPAEALPDGDRAVELMMMGLRLSEGVDLARFSALGGTLDATELAALEAEGFVARSAGRLRATAAGRAVLNAVLGRLL